jgi:hypothetical protein
MSVGPKAGANQNDSKLSPIGKVAQLDLDRPPKMVLKGSWSRRVLTQISMMVLALIQSSRTAVLWNE